jgi:hypothetical protein
MPVNDVVKDPLITKLHDHIVGHDMAAASQDARQIIQRDTDLSNPANTQKLLSRDADALRQTGISNEMLEQVGILPKAHIEIQANDKGAVVTDGKTSETVNPQDVLKNYSGPAPVNHGEVVVDKQGAVGDNGAYERDYHYKDGWRGTAVRGADGTLHVKEWSPDHKDSLDFVEYPDGFTMARDRKDGHESRYIKYPPTKDGRVYSSIQTDHDSPHKYVTGKDGHTLPVIFGDDMQVMQDIYKYRVRTEEDNFGP